MSDLFKPGKVKDESIESLLEKPKEETFPEQTLDREKHFLLFPDMNEEVLDYYIRQVNWKPAFMNFNLETKKWKKFYDMSISFHYDQGRSSFTNIRISELPKKRPKIFREKNLNQIMGTAKLFVTTDDKKDATLLKANKVYTWIGHQKQKDCYSVNLESLSSQSIYDKLHMYINIKNYFSAMSKMEVNNTQVCMLNSIGQLFDKDEYLINPLIPAAKQKVIQIPHSKSDQYPEIQLMKDMMPPK